MFVQFSQTPSSSSPPHLPDIMSPLARYRWFSPHLTKLVYPPHTPKPTQQTRHGSHPHINFQSALVYRIRIRYWRMENVSEETA